MSFLSVKRSRRESRCNLWLWKDEKTFWFCDLGIFKDSAFTAVKRDAKFLTCVWKGYDFSVYNGIRRALASPWDLRQSLVNKTPCKIFVYKSLSRKWPASETTSPFSLLPNGVLLRLLRLNKVTFCFKFRGLCNSKWPAARRLTYFLGLYPWQSAPFKTDTVRTST